MRLPEVIEQHRSEIVRRWVDRTYREIAPRAVPRADVLDEMALVIDQRYAEWVYAGRPELPPEDEPGEEFAALLDNADLPPEITEEAVRSMSPDEIVAALERALRDTRRP